MNCLYIRNLPVNVAVYKIWQRCQVKIKTVDEHFSIGIYYAFQECFIILFIISSILPSWPVSRFSFSNDVILVILFLAFFSETNLSGWGKTLCL